MTKSKQVGNTINLIPRFPTIVALALLALSCKAQFSVKKARALIDAYARSGNANGAVLVAQRGHILFKEGYGYKDSANETLNDVHTIFQIASMTKQFTAAVILQLQAEKKLSVTDHLSKYFPSLPHGDQITLHNLLTHTSGLYNYTGNEDFQVKYMLPHSHEQIMALFSDRPLTFVPGTRFEYCNTNYLLLGYIIEKVTGKSYEQVVRDRILAPLKMWSSGFDFAHLQSPDKATGYWRNGIHLAPAPIADSTAYFSAGALYSSVEDLYKWDRALYTNAVLTPEERRQAFTPYKDDYGYGWFIGSMYGRPILFHGGTISGFTSYIARFPTEETVIILLDNSSFSHLEEIQNKLAAIVFGQPY